MSVDPDPLDLWSAHLTRFRVAKAHVTATPAGSSDEDLTVLRNLSLIVEEGRYEALREDETGAPAPSMLKYGCYVRVDGSPMPSVWVGADADIVITGVHENSWGVIVAGRGAIGHDEHGVLEISFDVPPRIAVIDPEASDQDDAAES